MQPALDLVRPPDQQLAISQWLPDETLFSLCSRFHRISGNRRPDQTCLQLFGHARQGSTHDFPARLGEFERRTNGTLGSAEEIARQRSLLPYFFPFRTPEDAQNALAAVTSGAVAGLKARLGVLASRFGAAHPLKACRQCMGEDERRLHTSYWHREHQWPGALVCVKHGRLLDVGLGKVNAEGRFHWYLPDDLRLSPVLKGSLTAQQHQFLASLSGFASGLGNLPVGFHFDQKSVSRAYRQRLVELGLSRSTTNMKLTEFDSYLISTVGWLETALGLECLSGATTALSTQFARLVRGARGGPHPLRHVLLAAALFNSWETFLGGYRAAMKQDDALGTFELNEDSAEEPTGSEQERRGLLLQAVARGASASAAARAVGVAVATAMAWLSDLGQQVPRRPKSLTEDRARLATLRLRQGADKSKVAAAVSMSPETITRLIRTTPGLHLAWRIARMERQRRVARAAWTRTATRLGDPSPKQLRDMQPAIFAWLYRNDKAWLQDFTRRLTPARKSNHAHIKWDSRDADLAAAIRQAALRIIGRDSTGTVKLSQLCDAIDGLKGRLSSLDRLPLTRAAIAQVRSGSRSHAESSRLQVADLDI